MGNIKQGLVDFEDPFTGKKLSPTKIRDVTESGDRCTISLEVGYPTKNCCEGLVERLNSHLESYAEGKTLDINVLSNIEPHEVQKGVKRFSDIKNIIAVASGKGGVGKSTVTANLALALKTEGASVGILDADIFGPSQPTIMGSDAFIDRNHDESMDPIEMHGIQTISAGYLVKKDSPIMWRGPMVSQALSHLMNETFWADLDYLIVDMPPGTGDVQLSLAQEIPVSGAVIVTTPQDVALLDARKALTMFNQMKVDVLGVIENMSVHVCESCGHEQHIFGQGGGLKMADDFEVDYLGSLPLDIRIREDSDSGCPTVVADPDGAIAGLYHDVALKMAGRLSLKKKDYSAVMPEVKVQGA